MSILIGAVAASDAASILSTASYRASLKQLHASYAHIEQSRFQVEPVQQLNSLPSTQLGIVYLSPYADAHNFVIYRQRLLVGLLGRIENIEPLVAKLQAQAYDQHLQRQEDVIAALIDWHYRSHKDLLTATRLALGEVQGYFSCCILALEDTPSLICCSKGAPLYLGSNPNGRFFCNDAKLIKDQSALLVELHTDELAQLSAQQIHVIDYTGTVRHKDPVPAHTAGTYPHHLLADIMAQPQICADLINHFLNDQLAVFLNQLGTAHRYERVLLIASGSSHHAAQCAQHWLISIAQLPCSVHFASEYRFQPVLYEANTLVIAISQSGETIDTIAALRHAIAGGFNETVAICNQANSTLNQIAKYHLHQYAGPELSAISTKTFSTQLLCLYFIAVKLAQGKRIFASSTMAELNLLPRAIEETIHLSTAIKMWAQSIALKRSLFMIGRHALLPIAMEAAQKLKEIAYIHAEAYPSGEFKHGPVTLIDRSTPVIASLPWDLMADKTLANLQEARSRQGEIFVISDAHLNSSEHFHCIQMPSKLNHLNPLLYNLVFQLLSYYTALSRGNEIDTPRHISKAISAE